LRLDALQATLEKINLKSLLADLSFQFRNPAFPPTLLSVAGEDVPGPARNSRRHRCSTFGFTSNPRATSAIDTPCSSRRTAASLNSFVNCLRDNPMTQFSIR